MKENLLNLLEKWLQNAGMASELSEVLSVIIVIIAIALVSWLADFLTNRILLTSLTRIIRKTRTAWDDILLEQKLFKRVAHFAPAIIVYYTIDYAFPHAMGLTNFIETAAVIYMLIISAMVIASFLNGINVIYDKTARPESGRSIKSYIQVLKIIDFFVFGIAILAIILNKPIGYFITGLGAMAAVLLLIFKDSILGLVAGVQITANDMARLGDWISMPSHNADGPIIDITLNTVKVQNWDKTIATVPTYALVSESFNNWRGMEESGGRRIMRSIHIDVTSIRFADDTLADNLAKLPLMSEEIEKIKANKELEARKRTNIGLYRLYVQKYISTSPKINQDMTQLIRHLEPGAKGLPIQVYAFSKIQDWADYEAVQADIFDHLLAITPEFDLQVFQEPSGTDFQKLLKADK